MAHLLLKFVKAGSLLSRAHIALGDYATVKDADGTESTRLGPDCANALEVEMAAEALKRELDAIVADAKRKFSQELGKPAPTTER